MTRLSEGAGGSGRWVLLACAAPAAAFFVAFWALPAVYLAMLPARSGWAAYAAVLTNDLYLRSLANTVVLSLAVTAATLVLGAAVGLYLGRREFPGKHVLVALLTLPLSFPGVVVGFFVILLGGRQGVLANLTDAVGLGRVTIAYDLSGLFLAYLYFSLPRTIAAYSAAAEALDVRLEEAARTLGASRWRVARDTWLPQLAPTSLACGAIVFATAMGAFGTAFTLASRFEVLPITIYDVFTNYADFAMAASLSLSLGFITWLVLFVGRHWGGGVEGLR